MLAIIAAHRRDQIADAYSRNDDARHHEQQNAAPFACDIVDDGDDAGCTPAAPGCLQIGDVPVQESGDRKEEDADEDLSPPAVEERVPDTVAVIAHGRCLGES